MHIMFIKKEWKVSLFVIQKCIHNTEIKYFSVLVFTGE
jgi:hypothetical protein